jgi:Ran GTPase-activating protein (RanGAP) involved in mRNA processing and transport
MTHMTGYDRIDSDTPVDGLTAVLAAPLTKSVVHLGLDSSLLTAELLGAVVKSKLMKQLKTLDLSNGLMGDDRVKVLIGAKKQLTHLESIDLRHTGLTPEQGKKITAALPNAKVGKKADDKGPNFYFRYIACME